MNGLLGENHNPFAKKDEKHDKTLDLAELKLPRENQKVVSSKKNSFPSVGMSIPASV